MAKNDVLLDFEIWVEGQQISLGLQNIIVDFFSFVW